MKKLLIVVPLLLLFSSNLLAQSFKTQHLPLDTSIEKPVVKLSNGLLYFNSPIDKHKDATILTSNNNSIVIFKKIYL